jgi:hypothetical protein
VFRKNRCLAVPSVHAPSKARLTRWRPGKEVRQILTNLCLVHKRSSVIDYSQETYPLHMTLWCIYVHVQPCLASLIPRHDLISDFVPNIVTTTRQRSELLPFLDQENIAVPRWSGVMANRPALCWDLQASKMVLPRFIPFSSLDCFFCVTVEPVRTF